MFLHQACNNDVAAVTQGEWFFVARLTSFVRRHPLAMISLAMVGTLAGVGTWVYWTQVRVPYVEVSFLVPSAPELAPSGPDQTVYRIDASRSSVSYQVTEELAGAERDAVGTTQGVAGDILVDAADPSASEVGPIVVNVQQFTSDEELRDQRLQHDFLQSKDFPLATFDTTSIEGLPGTIEDGTAYEVTLTGDLTVKETTAPATLTGTVTRDGEELAVQATADVLMSTFDVGPIRLLGMVSTADEVRLTIDAVAVDTASADPPSAVVAPQREVAVGEGPSFASEIQPIIEEKCASCHAPGEVGALYWEVETAGDAVPVASGLGLVVQTGYMPPWHATDVGVPLQGDPSLSQDQIDAVVAWADAGGPLDVDPATPLRATNEVVPDIRPDLEVALPEPYDGSEATPNDYRCFILDPGFTEPTWLTGHQFVPDQVEITHHATMFRLPKERRADAEARDAADEGPGWQCFGQPGGRQFGGWAPGSNPANYPDGTGLRFEAGEAVIVQMHYHFAHTAPPDQSKMVFELAPGTLAENDATLDPIEYDVYLGPAEIPCRSDQTGPLCDRDTVIAELVEEFGGGGAAIPEALMGLCGAKLSDFEDMTDGTASADCTHRARHGGEVLFAAGHMHERGATFRMTINEGTPDEKILLDIDNWDFSWQRGYSPVETITIERGDEIHIECSWDRSRKPQVEPRYITWAEGTEDEMCYSTLAVIDRDG